MLVPRLMLLVSLVWGLSVPPKCTEYPGDYITRINQEVTLNNTRDDAFINTYYLNPYSTIHAVESAYVSNYKALFTEKFGEDTFPIYSRLQNDTSSFTMPLAGAFAPQYIGEVTDPGMKLLKPGEAHLVFDKSMPNIITGPLEELLRIFDADKYARLQDYDFAPILNKIITIGDIFAQHLRSLASIDEYDGDGLPDASRWLNSLNKVTLRSILKTYVDPYAELGETGVQIQRILTLLNSILVSISNSYPQASVEAEVGAGAFEVQAAQPSLSKSESDLVNKELMRQFVSLVLGDGKTRVARILQDFTKQRPDLSAYSSALLSIVDIMKLQDVSTTLSVGLMGVAMSKNPVQAALTLMNNGQDVDSVDSTTFIDFWERLRSASTDDEVASITMDGITDVLLGIAEGTDVTILKIIQQIVMRVSVLPMESISQYVTDVISIVLDEAQVPLFIQSADVDIVAWTHWVVDLIQGPWSILTTIATTDRPLGTALGLIDSLLIHFDAIRIAQESIARVLEIAASPIYETLQVLEYIVESPEPFRILGTLLRRYFPDVDKYSLPWPEWARIAGEKVSILANIYDKALNCILPDETPDEVPPLSTDSVVLSERLKCVGVTIGDFVDFIQRLVPADKQAEFQEALRQAGQAVTNAYQYILPITRAMGQWVDTTNPNAPLALARTLLEALGGYPVITDGVTRFLQALDKSPVFFWLNLAVQTTGSLLDILTIPQMDPAMPYIHGVQKVFTVLDVSTKWFDFSANTQDAVEPLEQIEVLQNALQQGRDILFYPFTVIIGTVNNVYLEFNKLAAKGELGPLFTLTFNSYIQVVMMLPEDLRLELLTNTTTVAQQALAYTAIPRHLMEYLGDLIPSVGEHVRTDDVFYALINATYTAIDITLQLNERAKEGATIPNMPLQPLVEELLTSIHKKTYSALINTLDTSYLQMIVDIIQEIGAEAQLNQLVDYYMGLYVRPFTRIFLKPDNVYSFIDYLRRESSVGAYILNGNTIIPLDFNLALTGKRGAITAQLYSLPQGPQVYPLTYFDRGFWMIVGGSAYGHAQVCHFVLEERVAPVSSRPGAESPVRLFANQRVCYPFMTYHGSKRPLPEIWPIDRLAGLTGEFVKATPESPSVLITHGNQAMGILDYESVQGLWTFRQTTYDIFVSSTDYVISPLVSERMGPLTRGGGFQTYGFYAQLIEGQITYTADHMNGLCSLEDVVPSTAHAHPYRSDVSVTMQLNERVNYREAADNSVDLVTVPFSVPPFSDSCSEGYYLDNSAICQPCDSVSIYQYCNEARPAATRLALCPPTSVCSHGVARMCDPSQNEYKPSTLSPVCIACPTIAVVNTPSRCEFCAVGTFKDTDSTCSSCTELLKREGSWYCRTNSIPLTSMRWSEPIQCPGTVSEDGMSCIIGAKGSVSKEDDVGTVISPGAIAGIVIGCIAFASIAAGSTVFAVRRSRKKKEEAPKEPLRSPVPTTK